MARIYKITDKIEYQVGEISIKISPLSVEDKMILTEYGMKSQRGDVKAMVDLSMYALRCSIKEISGLENADGSPYELTFENNKLTEECVQDLLNVEQSNKMIALCSSFINGIPNVLPEGVSIAESPKKRAKVTK